MSDTITKIPIPKGFMGWNYDIKVSDHTTTTTLSATDGGVDWIWTDGTLSIATAKSPVRLLPSLQQRTPWRDITRLGAVVGDVVWEIVEYVPKLEWSMGTDPVDVLMKRFGAKGGFSKLKLKRAFEKVDLPDGNGGTNTLWVVFKSAMTESQREDFDLAQNLQLDDEGFQQMFPSIRMMLQAIGYNDTDIIELMVDIKL